MKIAIAGIFGRVGQHLVKLIMDDDSLSLIGGTFNSESAYPTQTPFMVSTSIENILVKADVLIDFSVNTQVSNHLKACRDHQKMYVGGVTNLSCETLNDLKITSHSVAVFYDSNMSHGLSVLKKLVGLAAQMMKNAEIEIFEKHQTLKKDAPSGTALAIAQHINVMRNQQSTVRSRDHSHLLMGARQNQSEVGISFSRGGNDPGRHDIIFCLEDEVITFQHQSFNRAIYARGAIRAMQWLRTQKPGLYNMQDIIEENFKV